MGTPVAAPLNPLDVAVTNDQFPVPRLQAACVANWKAVVQFDDGTRRYLAGPPAPFGTLADRVPVPDAAAFPVQPGAAALVVAGWSGRPREGPQASRRPRLRESRFMANVAAAGRGGDHRSGGGRGPGSWSRTGE